MDMNGSKGTFKVRIDVYLHSCSKLECLCLSNELRFLRRGPDWQWTCSVTVSRVTTAYVAAYVLSQTKIFPSVKYSTFR
jgi:hypothetical protein